ncbi:MAG: iron ABC transporter permease [Deltaproteobacteria bacterium]|nr:iron ABC transporter permease [Deltaproteobacteria bacterium]
MPFRSKLSSGKVLSRLIGYLTVIGTLLLLIFFLIWPVATIVAKAFTSKTGFTLEYFSLLFSNDIQLSAIGNSILISLGTTFFATLWSLPLAIISARFKFRGKGLLTGLLLVPMVMPPFVGAIGMQRFFARFGAVNIFLMDKGIISSPIAWLTDENMIWAVIFLEVLHLYPILYLNLTSALSNIDPSLEEMAQTLGVSRLRQYWDIVWPLARPGYFAGAIIVFIWSLTDLGTPLLVGFHNTMPVHIFNLVTDINENPVGYALVFFVIVMTISFFLVSRFFVSGKKYQMLARGHVTSSVKQASRAAQVFIFPFLVGTILVALIPHFTVLITSLGEGWFMTALPEQYTLKYYAMVFQQEVSEIGIKNSLLFASLSTLLDLVLGILIAFVVTRKLIPMSGLLDAVVMVPLALPGIVLAFGYVVTYTDTFLDPLHNPVPLLVIAYGIRRLPYMVRSASGGLQQISSSLEEASECFGASKFHTLRKITLPLIAANLLAGGLLCFSYAVLDVSDSLILAMKDRFYPITKAIYALYLEQGSGEFVASALGMISMLILAGCILAASAILGKKLGEMFRS